MSAKPSLSNLFTVHRDDDALHNFRDAIVEGMRQGLSDRQMRDQVRFVPAPGATNLRSLSATALSARDPTTISLHCYVFIREVQALMDKGSDSVRDYQRDLERAERALADLTLKARFDKTKMSAELKNGGEAGLTDRHTGDAIARNARGENPDALRERHRNVVFVARCKIIDALRNVAHLPASLRGVRDQMRTWSLGVDDRRLALWMRSAGICDHSLLVLSSQEALETPLSQIDDSLIVGHRVLDAGLMQLWLCMKMLAEHWPKAPLSPELVRLVDLLWQRTAFFLSYRERVNRATDALLDTRRSKVLGLSLEMWQGGAQSSCGTLLDSPAFICRDAKKEFAHINMLFMRETERLLCAFERDIRCAAGFVFHRTSAPQSLGCASVVAVTERHVQRFEEFCAVQLRSSYKTFIRERFIELVHATVLRPSDPERFRKYNPNDAARARNILASQRRNLYKQVNERLVEPQLKDTWNTLRGRRDEPAYTLLAVLCTDFAMREATEGGRLKEYYHETNRLEPFSYTDERAGNNRTLGDCLHRVGKTTGTMRYYHKIRPSKGVSDAPRPEVNYPHPLIVRSLNSLFVLYKGALHHAPLGFGQAFLVWLRLMCTDERILGNMPSGASLFALWSKFEGETNELCTLAETAERRKKRWDPYKRLINADYETARLRNDTSHTQFSGQ